MQNQHSIEVVDSATWNIPFKRPLYREYAFAQLPHAVKHLLGVAPSPGLAADALGGDGVPYEMVIMLLIDGFGWNLYERYGGESPSLQHLETEGILSKLSSQFPTTTAAHITTIHTGLEVGQTGIYEWFYYEPRVDHMISPLLFSFARDHEPETLLKANVSSQEIFPFETLYQQLQKEGVASAVFQPQNIAHSPYSQAMCAGAEFHGYGDLKEGLKRIVELCERPQPAPRYVYLYFGEIDAMGHRHGIEADALAQAIQTCWKKIERELYLPLKNLRKRIALLITADHGMSPVHPKTTLHINERFPRLVRTLKRNRQGAPLVPAGSCRDFFLHVREECLQETYAMLKEGLEPLAQVHYTKELLDMHFFGSHAHLPRLVERLGDIVVLPLYSESVWWHEPGVFEQHFYGAHGGLTKEEIEIPLFFCQPG